MRGIWEGIGEIEIREEREERKGGREKRKRKKNRILKMKVNRWN